MATQSTIEWTEATWNPLTGCNKISPGCKFCYAERFSRRLKSMGQKRYQNGFKLTLQPEALIEPYKWKKSRVVFVNSMSDLFHKDVPIDYIKRVFKVMNDCSQHQFQVLTKRADFLKRVAKNLEWTDNIWMGVSVENQKYTNRIDYLRDVPAKIRFLSIEPLIGPVDNLNLQGIHWVIVGGESGPGSRPMKIEWVTKIRDLCIEQKVPFFFKQWGGFNKKKTGRILVDKEWNEMPRNIAI